MAEAVGEALVGLVVVSYGDPTVLEEHALSTPLPAWVRVVVVDNPSTDEHRSSMRRLRGAHGFDLLEPATNLGFGGGANTGIAHALRSGCAAVVLLNPDARLDATSLSALRSAALADPGALVSPVVLRPDGRTWFDGAELDLRTGTTRRSRGGPLGPDVRPWLSGACLAASAAAWRASGGFDERYFLYWEDVELSQRWLAGGGALRVLPEATAVHAVGGTQTGAAGGKSLGYYRFNCRNRLLLARGLPPRRRAAWVAGAPGYAREVLSRGGPHRGLAAVPPLRAALRGTVEGLLAVLAPRSTGPDALARATGSRA